MYPLDQGMWGPTVRISHLRDELSHLVDLDVVAGYRSTRRARLARYAFTGRLRGLDGIYVESSTFLPAEADLAMLGLARALGIPVVTYVRDAYQLFPALFPRIGWKARLAGIAVRPTFRALRAVSSRLAFPSIGLATAVLGRDMAAHGVLLPPGAPPPVEVPRDPAARRLLFVGDARHPIHGVDRLIRAVGLARQGGIDLELTVVARPGQQPPPPHPAWLRIERAEGEQIERLLPDVIATVIPRPRNAYTDLALPIKLYDYLAYGRPLVVTDCDEQARAVTQADAGIVCGDTVEALARAMVQLAEGTPAQLDRWSANAAAAAARSSWAVRARQIHDLFISLAS